MPKKDDKTSARTDSRADQIRTWATSSDGQRAIMESLKEAEAMTTQFREAQRVDPESLTKPVTL